MIGQYLSNTNEIGTVLILSKILELNKAKSQVWLVVAVVLIPRANHGRRQAALSPGPAIQTSPGHPPDSTKQEKRKHPKHAARTRGRRTWWLGTLAHARASPCALAFLRSPFRASEPLVFTVHRTVPPPPKPNRSADC
jgi:hypothetical protein